MSMIRNDRTTMRNAVAREIRFKPKLSGLFFLRAWATGRARLTYRTASCRLQCGRIVGFSYSQFWRAKSSSPNWLVRPNRGAILDRATRRGAEFGDGTRGAPGDFERARLGRFGRRTERARRQRERVAWTLVGAVCIDPGSSGVVGTPPSRMKGASPLRARPHGFLSLSHFYLFRRRREGRADEKREQEGARVERNHVNGMLASPEKEGWTT